jgi:hypothetical protein
MKRIAIFTEGQTELIFVREFLLKVGDLNKISFECVKLHAGNETPVDYDYNNPLSKIHFLIINVQNDNKVLSAILEKENYLLNKKQYKRIIGLRDMYSRKYREVSPGKISKKLIRETIETVNEILEEQTTDSEKIGFYFSIMEIETWILSMYNLFAKINEALTVDHIEVELGFNLSDIDPQLTFFKPSNELSEIFKLVDESYDKKLKDVERICNYINVDDYQEAIENERCVSFSLFQNEIQNCLNC